MTSAPPLILGSPQWLPWALALLGASALALAWSYVRAPARGRVRLACATLKALGLLLLVFSLVEPLLTGTRPRRGANAFVILADNSQSLTIRDADAKDAPTRGDWMRGRLGKDAKWTTRLGQDFDVRRYVFDSHLRGVDGFEPLSFDGTGSTLSASLDALARRFRGLPLAGILLLTDGNKTDAGDADWSALPPVYPLAPPSRGAIRDVGVNRLSVSQTNFEAAPVVLHADVSARGFRGRKVAAVVTDESGKEVAREEQAAPSDAEGEKRPLGFRFQFRPEHRGVSIYKVTASPAEPNPPAEQTDANNSRLVVVDQGVGPYRVLYVGGRPNWEFKFLRRAIADDEQVELVGLLRIARRQPKFDFQSAGNRTISPLYNGFDHPDEESAERSDQPVLIRLGTADEAELRDGFPKTADELYKYHAVVLDDTEASFFTQDQLALLRNFVSVRGGGLLMLGGPDSFSEGKYDRTPVGDLLPIYLNRRSVVPTEPEPSIYRLALTREGWLQPWVRLRKTEDEENARLATTAGFRTLSEGGNIKPGGVVLSEAIDPAGKAAPALVAQRFGKGHVAALMIGDLWRWGLKRTDPAGDDLEKAWRQTVRWLVADVPGRVEVALRAREGTAAPAVEATVRVCDPEFRPLDNARVTLQIRRPEADGAPLTIEAEPDAREPGTYSAVYVTRQPGAYRIVATAVAPDGSAVGERQAGWAAQPAADEFARLEPDRDYLRTIARKTGGEVVDGERLDAFVAGLSGRGAPITEPWTSPLWQHPLIFLAAIACLAAEWGLRRVNGLA